MNIIDKIINIMNEALELDRNAVEELISTRVSCNEALSAHKSIQVKKEQDGYSLGVLGLLNGIGGIRSNSWGHICVIINEDGSIVRFDFLKQSGNKRFCMGNEGERRK